MKKFMKVDENGLFLEDVLLNDFDIPEADLVSIPVPEGLYKPKWTGEKWIEGMAHEEIQAILETPKPKSPLDILGEQLVQKDIEIMQLNDTLGRQVVDHDIRLMMGGL